VLQPIFTTGLTSTDLDSARAYLQTLLSKARETNFKVVYSFAFFQVSNLRTLLNVENWDMDENFDPTIHNSASWTVYSFLRCLCALDTPPGQPPAAGLDMLQSKQLGSFVYRWFRSLDTKEGLYDAVFDQSILGTRLLRWLHLLDSPMLFALWQLEPRGPTYSWLTSLRMFLYPYAALVGGNGWLADFGFIPHPHLLAVSPTCINSTSFHNLMLAAEQDFLARWAPHKLTLPKYFRVYIHWRMKHSDGVRYLSSCPEMFL
jgi:hypothetical protein